MRKYRIAAQIMTAHPIDQLRADYSSCHDLSSVMGISAHEILPGSWHTSAENCLLTSVAAEKLVVCLYDSHLRAGGMAHFGLTSVYGITGILNERCSLPGILYMESLISSLVDMGSTRESLTAFLFGGAAPLDDRGRFSQISSGNIRFLQEYCLFEKIQVKQNHLGGSRCTAVEFNPSTGIVTFEQLGKMQL